MTSEEAINYIENYTWSTTKLGLDRTRELLARIGDPQKKLRFVHVAGSNGKGSTCAILDAVLRESGYRTGLYTSPYIERFHERMRVNGEDISDADLAAITERVRTEAEKMEDHPSQFELVTAIAMQYFFEARCDIVVLEVGMGGALDSTNAIDAPEVAVITNIGLEHTEYLGNTLEEIAATKAGIIKPGCAAVCYDGAPEVTEVVRTVCAGRGVPLTCVDFSKLTPLSHSLSGQRFLWEGREETLSLLGEHQLHNLATALETVNALRSRGWRIPAEAVSRALPSVRWPVRFEVLSTAPAFVLDGGHNPQCASALADMLPVYLPGEKLTFLMGVLADKDYRQMLSLVLPFAARFVCITPESGRALPAEDLVSEITALGADAVACETVEEAIAESLRTQEPVVAFGSLYSAGHIRRAFAPVLRKVLRKRGIAAREALSPEQRSERSETICAAIAASETWKNADCVLLYAAVKGEVSLNALAERGHAEGKRICYPLCGKNASMEAMLPDAPDALRADRYGIPAPDPDRSKPLPPEAIDLVVCPCTGFDAAGGRIGMGAGYYDRYLPRCGGAAVIAAAFEAQKLAAVPMSETDVYMGAVFTETAVYPNGEG